VRREARGARREARGARREARSAKREARGARRDVRGARREARGMNAYPLYRLRFDGRIPPGIEDEHVRGALEVQTLSACEVGEPGVCCPCAVVLSVCPSAPWCYACVYVCLFVCVRTGFQADEDDGDFVLLCEGLQHAPDKQHLHLF
jgi:hypothetical protein